MTRTLASTAPLTEQAYRMIRAMILHQELRPGERTSVAELASATGLGREPVKSAMARLAMEKLLIMQGRSGTRVAKLEAHQINQLFEMRRIYESAAAPLIAERITKEQEGAITRLLPELAALSASDESGASGNNVVDFIDVDVAFHGHVIAAANNPYLVDHYASLNLHLLISHYLILDGGFHSRQRHHEHEAIAEAIRKRDPEGISEALIQHADAIESIIMATIRQTAAARSRA